MSDLPRLSRETLVALTAQGLGPDVTAPPSPELGAGTGIVHLGLGAFTRAHQAVFTQRAAAVTGDDRWGIHGVTQRSPRVRDALVPQDGLYGVLELAGDSARIDLVGSITDVSFPGEDSTRVVEAIAAPSTHVVTLTVTEKGYRRAADGGPDFSDAGTAHDLAELARELEGHDPRAAAESRSAMGLLVRGLAQRWRGDAEPITVLCCDNLLGNGPQVERVVHGLADACMAPSAGEFLEWLGTHVTFPATMVDRIVPATSDAHRRRAEQMLGATDAGLVVAEPFMQWVIEDNFAGPRPAWELAGATLTDRVGPYEQTKLRILNGTHSALAYAGALRGHATIADALDDPALRDLARALTDEDAIPSLGDDTGIDLPEYRDSVFERFANTAIGHRTVQVAMDGSQKLPIRLLGTARARLDAGKVPAATAAAVAAWMLYVRATASGDLQVAGQAVALDDPLAEPLADAAAGPLGGLADRLLALKAVFPADLAGDDRWRAAVRAAVDDLAPVLAGGSA